MGERRSERGALCMSVVLSLLWFVGGQVKHVVNYQREVYKGRLTAVPNFKELTFRVLALCQSSDEIMATEIHL